MIQMKGCTFIKDYITDPGADPGIKAGGGRGFFFSKAWGLGAALRPPVGPGQRPGGGGQGRGPLKLLKFSDFRSKI